MKEFEIVEKLPQKKYPELGTEARAIFDRNCYQKAIDGIRALVDLSEAQSLDAESAESINWDLDSHLPLLKIIAQMEDHCYIIERDLLHLSVQKKEKKTIFNRLRDLIQQ